MPPELILPTDPRACVVAHRGEIDAAGTLVHYPVPVHAQPAYRGHLALDPSGLSRTDSAAREVLSLPMHGHLAESDAERVIALIGRILAP